jgi:hypothetical protein
MKTEKKITSGKITKKPNSKLAIIDFMKSIF